MASYLGQVKIGAGNPLPIGSMLYGTCDTAANTAAKVVILSSFDVLATGITVYVKFTYSNTASSPTLQVGSTTAKSIKIYGSTAAGTTPTTSWQAGAIVGFTYDGTNWVMNNSADSTNKTGIYFVIGTQSTATTSWTGSLSQVNALYDGLTICYYLPQNNTGEATLTLALSDSTTYAEPIYYNATTRCNVQYAAGSILFLTWLSNTTTGYTAVGNAEGSWTCVDNVTNNKVNLKYNVTDDTLDFVFV